MTDTRKLFFPEPIKTDKNTILFEERKHRIAIPEKDDYLILWKEEEKPGKFLGKTISVDNKKLQVTVKAEAESHLDRKPVTLDFQHILLNIGNNPPVMLPALYGVKVERFYDSRKTKMGRVFIWREMNEKQISNVIKTINLIYKKFRKLRLPDIFPLEIHIREPRGNTAGTYRYTGPDSDKMDILTLHPKSFRDSNLHHLIWHELGHGIQFRFSSKQDSEWMKTFVKYTKLTRATGNDLESILSDYLTYGENIRDSMDEKQLELLKEIISLINSKMNFRKGDLDTLAQHPDIIRSIWPDSVMVADREDVITEYANRNYREFFCESLAAIMTPSAGITVPDYVKKLWKKTGKSLKS